MQILKYNKKAKKNQKKLLTCLGTCHTIVIERRPGINRVPFLFFVFFHSNLLFYAWFGCGARGSAFRVRTYTGDIMQLSEDYQNQIRYAAKKIHPADPERAERWLARTFTPAFLYHATRESGTIENMGKLYAYDTIDRDYRANHITGDRT